MTSELRLRDYQVVARDFLRSNDRAALFLKMGLGKTAATLAALQPRHLPALVVAPKRVCEHVWPEERDLWRPDLRLALAAGSPAARAAALTAGADITVIGRDNIKDAARAGWRTVIIDESSGYKNRTSVRWRTMNRMVNHKDSTVAHVWQLTGTPAPNGLMDLWAPMYLLDKGHRLGRTLTEFRGRYFSPGKRLPNGIVARWDLNPGMDTVIHEKIADITLSMGTQGRVLLPPVTHNEVVVSLPPAVTKAYRELHDDLVTNMDLLGNEVHTATNAGTLSGKLSQLTAGFIYSDDADINGGRFTQVHDLKIRAVEEIVGGTGGSPVLVFYRFRPEREALLASLPGAMAIDDKRFSMRAWNSGDIPVLVAHPASAGHGLNLQHGGHTIVWTSLDWSLEYWQQANKRLARSGQKNPVVIHRISAVTSKGHSTIDRTIHRRLTGKTTVQSSLLDYLESPI